MGNGGGGGNGGDKRNFYRKKIGYAGEAVEDDSGVPYLHLVLGSMSEPLHHAHHVWRPPRETAQQYISLRRASLYRTNGPIATFRYVVQVCVPVRM